MSQEFRHFSKTVIFRVHDVASFKDLFYTIRPKIQLPGNRSAGRGDHRWSGGGGIGGLQYIYNFPTYYARGGGSGTGLQCILRRHEVIVIFGLEYE
jgi:hypothetical protein